MLIDDILMQAILKNDISTLTEILRTARYKDFVNWIYHEEFITSQTPAKTEDFKNFLKLSDKTLYPFTPLILAIKLNQLDTVKKLLAHGADINLRINDSKSLAPIDYALQNTKKPNYQLILFLLMNNADFAHQINNPILKKIMEKLEIVVKSGFRHDFFSQMEKTSALVQKYHMLKEAAQDNHPVTFHVTKGHSAFLKI